MDIDEAAWQEEEVGVGAHHPRSPPTHPHCLTILFKDNHFNRFDHCDLSHRHITKELVHYLCTFNALDTMRVSGNTSQHESKQNRGRKSEKITLIGLKREEQWPWKPGRHLGTLTL